MNSHNFSNMLPARRRQIRRQEGWSNANNNNNNNDNKSNNILSISGHKPSTANSKTSNRSRLYKGTSKRPSGKPRPRSGVVRPVAYILANNAKIHDDGLSPASDTNIEYNNNNNRNRINRDSRVAYHGGNKSKYGNNSNSNNTNGIYSSAGSQVTIGEQINVATNTKKTRNAFETYLRTRIATRNGKKRPKSASQAVNLRNHQQQQRERQQPHEQFRNVSNNNDNNNNNNNIRTNGLVPKLQLKQQQQNKNNNSSNLNQAFISKKLDTDRTRYQRIASARAKQELYKKISKLKPT